MAKILETGAVLDGFTIGEKIHKGGMAVLWSVSRPDIDLPILMKVPMILDGDDAEAIVGFEMEQMILPHLNGPHVPKFFGAGDFSVQPYIVMERVDGSSLYPMLEKTPLPAQDVAELGAKIATALADIHAQGVVHLDIKPSNVMLRRSGGVALIDFGLSRHLNLPDLLSEEFRLPLGTGPYMAPEQIFRVRDDPRSDIFALGVLLYHLGTGVRPFGFPRNSRALKRRLWRDPVPPSRLAKDFPPWLQEIVLRCLAVDPRQRYQSAKQLAFDLSHPEQVRLTERATKTKRDSLRSQMRRYFWAAGVERSFFASATQAPEQAPIVMAAIDLSAEAGELSDKVREMVGQKIATMPEARLACVNVLKQSKLQVDYSLDSEGRNIHVNRLVEIKEWARPLGLASDRISFHVLEATDPADALIGFAKANNVDQILIGARASSALRRYLGSVSAKVVAEAPCTVTVVRIRGQANDEAG